MASRIKYNKGDPTKYIMRMVSVPAEALFSFVGGIKHARKGSRFSRFFRQIFEHVKIKQIFGANLALLFVASSFVPKTSALARVDTYETNIAEAAVVFNTTTGRQFPVSPIRLTQGYSFYHKGLDLDGITGDPIKPIMEGKVIKVEYSRFGYGRSVVVDHKNGFTSLYAHLSKIEVAEGQEVTLSTKLGEMGATGRAFGDHLHLEVMENGSQINPFSVLSK